MERITHRDVYAMAGRLLRSMQSLGMATDGARMAIGAGSKLNGNSWSVELIDAGSRGEPFGHFHYGFTARDCYERLHAQCVALEAVAAR